MMEELEVAELEVEMEVVAQAIESMVLSMMEVLGSVMRHVVDFYLY